MSAELQDAVTLARDLREYVPDVELVTALNMTRVELEHVRRFGTSNEYQEVLRRSNDLEWQIEQGARK
jgi:hypothetical protein